VSSPRGPFKDSAFRPQWTLATRTHRIRTTVWRVRSRRRLALKRLPGPVSKSSSMIGRTSISRGASFEVTKLPLTKRGAVFRLWRRVPPAPESGQPAIFVSGCTPGASSPSAVNSVSTTKQRDPGQPKTHPTPKTRWQLFSEIFSIPQPHQSKPLPQPTPTIPQSRFCNCLY
jgi:hypothetical protein